MLILLYFRFEKTATMLFKSYVIFLIGYALLFTLFTATVLDWLNPVWDSLGGF